MWARFPNNSTYHSLASPGYLVRLLPEGAGFLELPPESFHPRPADLGPRLARAEHPADRPLRHRIVANPGSGTAEHRLHRRGVVQLAEDVLQLAQALEERVDTPARKQG